MKTKLFIRVDGNVTIGLGHVIRCIALSQMLQNDFEITFYSLSIPYVSEKTIYDLGFNLKKIKDESDFITDLSPNVIAVIDGYHFNSDYQQQIKKSGVILVCIDDLHDKNYFADLIINHAPGINESNYNIQAYTKLALGLKYALLRPSFLKEATSGKKHINNGVLFICFGGGDNQNITERVLNIIKPQNDFKQIIVVTGPAYQHLESFKSVANDFENVYHYHSINEEEMVGLMMASDLAIVPASGILMEMLCVGCRVISGKYVENQTFVYNNFKRAGLIFDGGNFNEHSILNAIALSKSALISDEKIPIDGNSPARILELFLNLPLKLRKANKSDCKLLFEWANEATTRKNAFNVHEILWEEHEMWFGKKMIDDTVQIFILEKFSEPIGQIRFEKKDDFWYIDYSIDKSFRGMKLGQKIVELGINEIPGNMLALVRNENKASCKVFENLKFQKTTIENSVNKYTLIR